MTPFQEEDKTARRLELLRQKEEEDSAQLLAARFGLPYLNLQSFPIELDAIKLIPEERARLAELAVLQRANRRLVIAVHNPDKEETKTTLRRLQGDRFTYNLYFVSKHSLAHAWEYYRKIPQAHEEVESIQVRQERIDELKQELRGLSGVKSRIESSLKGAVTEILEIILAGALLTDASDIHIEPQEGAVQVRFRLDGVLNNIVPLPQRIYTLLLSRIKLISELKLNVHDRAQDGRFTIQSSGEEIEVRTSILPGPHGENVVMRILNPKAILVSLEDLGAEPWVVTAIDKELKKPHGMILTTGPTGSGKTTTLYAFLRKILNPGIKVITIEDPIEYHLAGIEQTQTDAEKGYDFANGLRAIVRQDPDVILVGEIRDLETAETAMHAALTGHLVFSTLHTNSAAGTVPRLIDLGVRPNIIAPAINITIAQRLVRRLCPSCRIAKNLSAPERKEIEKKLAAFPPGIPAPKESTWTVFSANTKGCHECNHTGYGGRTGLFEIILMKTEGVQKLIMQGASEFDIEKEARQQGHITLLEDGLLKILRGITDSEEVERVVGSF